MEQLNIIADVAGQFDALERLAKKMPKAKFLGVGDLVDRGPKSKEVVEWFMINGDSLMGNHEHMMLDFLKQRRIYDHGIWLMNGGGATQRSYNYEVPKEHIEWLETRPLFYQTDELLVTHAPLAARVELKDSLHEDGDFELGHSVMWNRAAPKKRKQFQVFGHNSYWGLEWFVGEYRGAEIGEGDTLCGLTPPADAWAVCLDASQKKVLTGMHWPSMQVFQEPY